MRAMRPRGAFLGVGVWSAFVVVSAAGACDSSHAPDLASDDGSDASGSSPGASRGDASGSGGGSSSGMFTVGTGDASSDGPRGCVGLQCDVPGGCTTSITGTVYDPAGLNPLYDAVVFIPIDASGPLSPIRSGTNSCNTCEVSIGDYVVATNSLSDGTFKLTGVPAGENIPIVVQVGKWRRMATIPQVVACANTALPGASMTRLPAKRSEGNIPQMALVTGGQDNLGCFLAGAGLDPSEYSAPHAGGRLDIYQGLPSGAGGAPGLSSGTAGDCTSDNASCVWNSTTNLEAYDIVLFACEGDTFDPAESSNPVTNKTTMSKAALHAWLDEGGKVFATHYQYTWFKNGPSDFQGVADWLGGSGGGDTGLYSIDTTFPKGMVLGEWLGMLSALSNQGQIGLMQVGESVGAVNPPTQRWIYNPAADVQTGLSNNTKYMSFLTPIGGVPDASMTGDAGPSYCGKAVFSDLHAGGSPAGAIPKACPGPPLSAPLKALEFLFFDLSACVSNDGVRPPPPPPPLQAQ
jgi:hypothetical protein